MIRIRVLGVPYYNYSIMDLPKPILVIKAPILSSAKLECRPVAAQQRLTDGQVCNTAAVLEFVRNNATCHLLGDAHRAQVQGGEWWSSAATCFGNRGQMETRRQPTARARTGMDCTSTHEHVHTKTHTHTHTPTETVTETQTRTNILLQFTDHGYFLSPAAVQRRRRPTFTQPLGLHFHAKVPNRG